MANQETKIIITASTAQAEAALNSLGNTFKGMVGTLTGALSVGAFAGLIKSSIALQDELGSLSQKTGIAAKDLAGLKFAAEQNGTSLDVIAKATKELAINMTATPDKFAKLGINAKDATGALVQMADVVASMPDGMQKTALLANLMGKKVGPEMAEFLSQGGAAIREYIAKGQDIYKVTDESAASAKAYKDQMAELSARMSGVGIAISSSLLPGMNETAKAMNDLANEGHPVLALWRGLAGMGKVAWDLLAPPQDLKKEISSEGLIKDLQQQIGQLERNKQSGNGKLMQWIFGTPQEIDAEIKMLQTRIETIKAHAKELDKPAATDKPKTVNKNIADYLKGDPQGVQTLKALERDYQNELAKRVDALNAPLLSASEKQLADDIRGVSTRAQAARVELEKQKSSLEGQNKTFADYEQRLAEVAAKEQAQIAAIKDLRLAQDQLNSSWQYGASIALRTYIDEAANTAKQTEMLFTNAFKGMEDALVKFVRTGKLDFQSLADSIINDLIRMQVKDSVTGPLANIMSGWLGSGAQSAVPVVNASTMPNANGNAFGGGGVMAFANGGTFTNRLFSSPTPFRFSNGGGFNLGVMGEAGPEAVMPLTRGSDGKLGVRSQGGGGVSINYAPVIQIDARTDQAQVERLVSNAVKQGNAELVDTLQRRGML